MLGGVREDQVEAAEHGLLGEASPRNADDKDPRRVSVPIDVDPLAPRDQASWSDRGAGRAAGLLRGVATASPALAGGPGAQ